MHETEALAPFDDRQLAELLESIVAEYGYDFRQYAQASLHRRVAQAATHLGCASIDELRASIQGDRRRFAQLLRSLTVHVSDMFRDPQFFQVFRSAVVPQLATYPSVKLWVAGCSSGEEVYSIAIILLEEGLLERTTIYATDIDPWALGRAEAGVYSLDRIAQFTESHRLSGATCSLSDYYTAGYDGAVFDRNLRKSLVFADHSLATDAAFGEMHVVTCRNVLIYFNQRLQRRALGLFDESLVRRGFLGLGSRETLRFSDYAGSYLELENSSRWYRKL